MRFSSAAAAIAALLVAAPAAGARPPAKADGEPCPDQKLERVFADHRDRAHYVLAPGGDFETEAADWLLGEGASLAPESSSILLGEALGAGSLELAEGATATTPPICVQRGFRYARFAARTAGEERGAVGVHVVYTSGRVKRAGKIRTGADWAITRRVSLAQGRFRVRKGRSATIQLRFTALRGAVRIDDVYVDPRLRK